MPGWLKSLEPLLRRFPTPDASALCRLGLPRVLLLGSARSFPASYLGPFTSVSLATSSTRRPRRLHLCRPGPTSTSKPPIERDGAALRASLHLFPSYPHRTLSLANSDEPPPQSSPASTTARPFPKLAPAPLRRHRVPPIDAHHLDSQGIAPTSLHPLRVLLFGPVLA